MALTDLINAILCKYFKDSYEADVTISSFISYSIYYIIIYSVMCIGLSWLMYTFAFVGLATGVATGFAGCLVAGTIVMAVAFALLYIIINVGKFFHKKIGHKTLASCQLKR